MSGTNTFSRVTVSGILVGAPYAHLDDAGEVSHVTLELAIGEAGSKVYCTAFAGTARLVARAKLEKGEHLLLNGRLRQSKSGDRSNWVEVQEVGVGVRELEDDES